MVTVIFVDAAQDGLGVMIRDRLGEIDNKTYLCKNSEGKYCIRKDDRSYRELVGLERGQFLTDPVRAILDGENPDMVAERHGVEVKNISEDRAPTLRMFKPDRHIL